jgi:hypothetical protein
LDLEVPYAHQRLFFGPCGIPDPKIGNNQSGLHSDVKGEVSVDLDLAIDGVFKDPIGRPAVKTIPGNYQEYGDANGRKKQEPEDPQGNFSHGIGHSIV